ncbi:MAG: hypothetical protein OHK0029_15800 [Armatimonadaceae bacterium]
MADAEQTGTPSSSETEMDVYRAGRLAQAVMRRQLALSLRVGAVFFVLVFGLPLFNWLLPQIANQTLSGFTLTWLILGILFYPLTWALSGYFIRESERMEHEIAVEHQRETTYKEVG